MASFYSNSYDGRQLRLDVSQSGSVINWTLHSSGGSIAFYSIYNTYISIAGHVVYNPGTVGWNSKVFPAATGNVSGSIDIGGSASGRDIAIVFHGTVYYNRWDNYGGNMYVSPSIYAPALGSISINSNSDSSIRASFGVANANGQWPTFSAIDIFTDSGCTQYVKGFAGYDITFTELNANRDYWVRGYAENSGGRTYTNIAHRKTSFILPSAPTGLNLVCEQLEPIPTAKYNFTWNAASAGSTAIAGYRVRLFINGVERLLEDTENTGTSYEFNMSDYNVVPGDSIQAHIHSYCKDWAGNKHFNSDGVYSNTIIIVSDKFVYLSNNGESFDKRKMYISLNGSSFIEVKKEKFRII